MRTIANGYKPNRYAKRDRHGILVNDDQRAEAIKDYLEHIQWGHKQTPTVSPEEAAMKEALTRKCEEIINKTKEQIIN